MRSRLAWFIIGCGVGSAGLCLLLWRGGILSPRVAHVRAASAPAQTIVAPIDHLKPSDILDTFNQARPGGRPHEATDILAPRGEPVHAMVDGVVKKLFLSKPGGITIYEFDEDEEYCYYYAHLDHYAEGLHENQRVTRGDAIGYVGNTGNASAGAPHLHLAIFRLGPEKRWWEGTPINPYPILLETVK
jgi:peptidoglycan LD-endopeptidase LytH